MTPQKNTITGTAYAQNRQYYVIIDDNSISVVILSNKSQETPGEDFIEIMDNRTTLDYNETEATLSLECSRVQREGSKEMIL